MALPAIFLVGTASGDVTDNIITLYSQTSSRLELSDEEIGAIEKIFDGEHLETMLYERLRAIQSPMAKTPMLNIAITAAAASCLEFNTEQHACVLRFSECLGLHYSRQQLEQKIDYLLK